MVTALSTLLRTNASHETTHLFLLEQKTEGNGHHEEAHGHDRESQDHVPSVRRRVLAEGSLHAFHEVSSPFPTPS